MSEFLLLADYQPARPWVGVGVGRGRRGGEAGQPEKQVSATGVVSRLL